MNHASILATMACTAQTTLSKMIDGEGKRIIIVGDQNARHRRSDKTTNCRNTAVRNTCLNRNLKVLEPPAPSYIARGRKGASKPGLPFDSERAIVRQPGDEKWDNTSDHSPLLYEVAKGE